jgi:hypothetical protein
MIAFKPRLSSPCQTFRNHCIVMYYSLCLRLYCFQLWNCYIQRIPYIHGMQTVFITENNNSKKFSICQVKVTLWPTVSQPVCLLVLPRLLRVLKWGLLFDERKLIRHSQHIKHGAQQFYCFMCIRCCGDVFTETLPSSGPVTCLRHGPHRKHRVQQFFWCCVLFVAAGTCLPSRSLVSARVRVYRAVA